MFNKCCQHIETRKIKNKHKFKRPLKNNKNLILKIHFLIQNKRQIKNKTQNYLLIFLKQKYHYNKLFHHLFQLENIDINLNLHLEALK